MTEKYESMVFRQAPGRDEWSTEYKFGPYYEAIVVFSSSFGYVLTNLYYRYGFATVHMLTGFKGEHP